MTAQPMDVCRCGHSRQMHDASGCDVDPCSCDGFRLKLAADRSHDAPGEYRTGDPERN